jgi:two-component system response regulator (stage 0 sporulation protein F)
MAKIIVIDDEEDIRVVLKQVLERAGYDVSVAESGKEGLKLMEEEGADLVITDVIMPGMDGVSLTREIREKFRDTRILVISGGGNVAPKSYEPGAISTTAFLSSAKNAGADETMTKPFDRQELMKIISELLD